MVTRRNVPRVDTGISTPQADTFRALNVPFVPATRRSGVGDNANRLANALRGFSASLDSVLGPMAADEDKLAKLRKMDAERQAGVNTHGNQYRKSGNPEDAKKDASYRRDYSYVMGFDPNASLANSEASFDLTEGPAFRAHLQSQREALTRNGYLAIGEDGNPVEGQRLTPEIIIQQHEQLRAELRKRYPGGTVEEYNTRFKYEGILAAETKARLEGLKEAVAEQARSDYKTYGPAHNAKALTLAMQKGIPPENLWKEMVKVNDEEIAHAFYNVNGDYVPGGLKAKDRADVIVEGFRLKGVANGDEARYMLKVFDHAKLGDKHLLATHPEFTKRVQALRLEAQRVLAGDRINALKVEVLEKGMEVLSKKGMTYQEVEKMFGLEDGISTKYGDRASSPGGPKDLAGPTRKEMKAAFGQQFEAFVINRLGKNVPEEKVYADLAQYFSGTGLVSPTLEAKLKEYVPGNNQMGNEDPAFNSAYKAFEAIRAENPLALDDYFSGNTKTRDIFLAIEPLTKNRQLTPSQAYDIVAENLDSKGLANPEKRTALKDWFEANPEIDDVTRGQLTQQAQLMFGGSSPLTADDMKGYLDEAYKGYKTSQVTFNGYPVTIPANVDRDSFQASLQKIEQGHPLIKKFLNKSGAEWAATRYVVDYLDSNKGIYLKPMYGARGFMLVDKTKPIGNNVVMHNGYPLLLGYDDIAKMTAEVDKMELEKSAADTREMIKSEKAREELQKDNGERTFSRDKGHKLTEFGNAEPKKGKGVPKDFYAPPKQKDRSTSKDLPPSAGGRKKRGLFAESQEKARQNQIGADTKKPVTEEDIYRMSAEDEQAANQSDRVRELYQDYLPRGN